LLKNRIKIQNILLGFILAIFIGFTVYLATTVKMGVSSDSWYHLRVSQRFSETLTVPENIPETYKWRDLEHQPYLYFWINGRILNFNSMTFHFNEAILLRIINILYSLFTLIGVYILSKEFFKKGWLRLLPVFLLSNTLMFLMLSSSINYDNLANMLAVFSILFFIKSIKNRGDWGNLYLMIIVIALGSLTKYTFLPLAFILVLLSILFVVKNWKIYRREFKNQSHYLIIPILILTVMNIGVYGVNLIKFQSLTPKCLDVMTYDQCLENGVFYRDNVTIPAVEVNLFRMIFSGERLDPIRYTGIWIWEMSKRIFGIMGDKSLFANDWILPFYIFYILLASILGISNWKRLKKEVKYLSVITLFYLAVLLFIQNYDMYLKRSYPTLALQGRYMFPVISSFYILMTLFLNRIRSKWLRGLVFTGLVVLFIVGCLPFFFLNVESSWFGSIIY
jgi:hypothetical protein